MPDEKIQLDITAKDTASDKIDDVADKAEALEKLAPEIPVTADTAAAVADLAAVDDAAKALDKRDAELVIRAKIDAAKADLSALETQLRGLDDAAATTGKRIGDDIETGTTKAASATHSMAGNVIGDASAMATGFGPLGEAVGQLTEGILGGEVAMKELLAAGLGMGAIALVAQTITTALAETKAVDAFNKKKVEDFTKALREGKTVLDTLNAELRETGKIEFADQVTGKTRDLVGVLADANITFDEFLGKVALGKDGFRQWVIDQGPMLAANTDLNAVIQAGNQFIDDRTKAEKAWSDQQIVSGATAAETDRETRKLNAAWIEGTRAADTHAKATDGVATSQRNLKTTIDNSRTSFDKLRGALNVEQEALNFASQMQTALEKTQTAAGLTEGDIIAIKQSVIDAAETAGKSPVVVKAELDKVDAGDILTVTADVEAWYRMHPISLASKLDRPQLVSGSSGQGTAGPQMAGPQVVVNMPAGSRGVDVVRQVAGSARRSGRRYGAAVVTYARR